MRAGIVQRLPQESAVDEASLEQMVCQAGYRLAVGITWDRVVDVLTEPIL